MNTLPEMSDERPLPRADFYVSTVVPEDTPVYTAEQMRAYLSEGTASLKAENERLRAERESTSAALNVSWQLRDQLATQLRACERERDDLRTALSLCDIDCQSLHHSKKDRHTLGVPCPVVDRIASLCTPTPGKE